MAMEVKRFEEVLRRRDDIFFLRSNSAYTCFGCPAFNDEGLLVGLQSQLGADAPPSVVSGTGADTQMAVGASTILSIATIVKHMFANGHLGQVDRPLPADSLWRSWGIANDAARTILVIQNFHRNKELHRRAALHLFELTNSNDHIRAVASCNGGPVVLSSMAAHFEDPAIVAEALKALWNLGLIAESSPANQLHTAAPVQPIIAALTKYGGESEEIAQVAVVLLFNAASSPLASSASASAAALPGKGATVPSDALLRDGPPLVCRAMTKFPNVEVLQKFGLGFLRHILRNNMPGTSAPLEQQMAIDQLARTLVDDGVVEHCTRIMEAFPRSEFLHEHAAGFLECIGTNPKLRGHPALPVCVPQLIASILRFPRSHAIAVSACNALWGLGNDPAIRTSIFTHERGVEALQSAMSVGHSK